jgi:hypothetical protein
MKVNVARDFTKYPAGRYKRNGKTSGESFRERFLVPYLLKGEKVTVELDGTIGYGSSFLEEAFGGAVRNTNLNSQSVAELIELVSSNKALKEEILRYIADAKGAKTSG